MKRFCTLIIIFNSAFSMPVLCQQRILETFRYNTGSEKAKEIIKQKMENIKHTHSLLKGDIWDEIFSNIIYIPQATYTISYEGADSNNIQYKKRYITVYGFYMLNTEVTNKMYKYFLADSNAEKYQPHYDTDSTIKNADLGKHFYALENGKKIGLSNYDQLDDYPVVGITWEAAKTFCRWLEQKAIKIVDYKNDKTLTISFRLPIEANFEVAAIMNEVNENATAEDLKKSLDKKLHEKRKAQINYGQVLSINGIIVRDFDEDGYYFTNP